MDDVDFYADTPPEYRQEITALFSAAGAGTETPPGHWNTVTQRDAAIS